MYFCSKQYFMKSTGVNTSLSFSISFLLGTYLSSDSFAIAQWTLDYYKRKNNAFKVSSKDSENWQLKDKQWSGHWVGNWMTFFSLPRATSVLGIQIFIPYLWCRKQGSHDVSEKISPSLQDARHIPSSWKKLLHPPQLEQLEPTSPLFQGISLGNDLQAVLQ